MVEAKQWIRIHMYIYKFLDLQEFIYIKLEGAYNSLGSIDRRMSARRFLMPTETMSARKPFVAVRASMLRLLVDSHVARKISSAFRNVTADCAENIARDYYYNCRRFLMNRYQKTAQMNMPRLARDQV